MSSISSPHTSPQLARTPARPVEGAIYRTLWPALSRPTPREAPPKDIDSFGHLVRGMVMRRRAHHLDFARADRIIAAGKSLVNHSRGAFEAHVADVRQSVILARYEQGAIDAAFAAGFEAIRRTLGFSLHPVQILAGLAMSAGACAELATGEGKTITAILPAALDAWLGRGVHVVTVNDYLAGRDAQITAPAYQLLGLSVGSVRDESSPEQRRAAYLADVTYAADKQVLFDYLRDRLVSPVRPRTTQLLMDALAPGTHVAGQARADWPELIVQRGHYAAIVDEADSVLIDEAVTPAIISEGSADDAAASFAEKFHAAHRLAQSLKKNEDFLVDVRMRTVKLTPEGSTRLESMARQPGVPAEFRSPRRLEEMLAQALTATELYTNGDDYIVGDGKVLIVDRSTGRVLQGRQWQLGLHQAIEAKENVELTPERRTSTRSSYQNFFRRYRRLSGMSGTCWEVRHELFRFYKLPVVRVPTHKPVIRRHPPDRIFADLESKYEAIAERAAELSRAGQPVLVGTRSVATSEHLGQLLAQRNMSCTILNATREAEEAAIVENAGISGAITVATNMAGRGTDIRLNDKARAAGGLAVLATERHEESRVDRQLFGRAGRQGDPGLAEAFVSFEDDLMLRNAPHWLMALAKAARASGRRWPSRVLWSVTQFISGRQSAMMRAETYKAEAWLDLALHHEIR